MATLPMSIILYSGAAFALQCWLAPSRQFINTKRIQHLIVLTVWSSWRMHYYHNISTRNTILYSYNRKQWSWCFLCPTALRHFTAQLLSRLCDAADLAKAINTPFGPFPLIVSCSAQVNFSPLNAIPCNSIHYSWSPTIRCIVHPLMWGLFHIFNVLTNSITINRVDKCSPWIILH